MSMTSKRLKQSDAMIFVDMMNVSREIVHEAYNDPGSSKCVGMLRVVYNPLSQTFTFTFTK